METELYLNCKVRSALVNAVLNELWPDEYKLRCLAALARMDDHTWIPELTENDDEFSEFDEVIVAVMLDYFGLWHMLTKM